MPTRPELPPDEEHLLHLSRVQASMALARTQQLDPADPMLRVISVSISAIYQVATCTRGCRGGHHVLEAILGRAYNLAVGAWALIRVAQDDEALNLMRGIGEINNLLLLFSFEPDLISSWLSSSKKDRLRGFGPSQVRKQLAKHTSLPLAGDDWYSELCERFVHVHPGTRPAQYSHGSTGQIGPVPQGAGESHSIGELQTAVFVTALAACRWFSFDDTLKELGSLVEKIPISSTK